MNRNHNSDAVLFIIIAIAAFIGFICWKFSQAMGLDIETGAKLFLGLIVVGGITTALLYFGLFNAFWPVVLAVLWLFFWPALDYWSTEKVPYFALNPHIEKAWWAAWYTKAGGLIILLGGGYLYKHLFESRY